MLYTLAIKVNNIPVFTILTSVFFKQNKSVYHLRVFSVHIGLEDGVKILLQSDPALLEQLSAGHHGVGLPGEPGQGWQSRVHLHNSGQASDHSLEVFLP